MSDPRHTIASRNPVIRWLTLFAGWILLATGIVGLILPVMPGTVFLIMAAACFARSSPRFEKWLLEHPTFGPSVQGWRERGAIPTKAKAMAAGAMAASIAVMALTGAPVWATVLTAVIFALVNGWMMTRPSA